jgi:hypothetical protein
LVFHMINIKKPDFVGCNSLDADLRIERISQSTSV